MYFSLNNETPEYSDTGGQAVTTESYPPVKHLFSKFRKTLRPLYKL